MSFCKVFDVSGYVWIEGEVGLVTGNVYSVRIENV